MSEERVPPPTRLPSLLTTPLSWAYAAGINQRNRAFDAGKGVCTLDRAVISVGNLSTGGTGKTPMVQMIVQQLLETGHSPVIAMRGYGAKPGEKGDEQQEHEQALPGVPIIAQPDRAEGLKRLFETEAGKEIDCVVLDDGFQHRKIARDLNIVLIDASRPPDRDALLPKGHLRDPLSSLARAGLVVLTHAERVDSDEIDRLKQVVQVHASGVPVLCAQYAWSGFRVYERSGGKWEEQSAPVMALCGRSVRVVSGIGNSDAFISMVQAHGMTVEQHLRLNDHQSMSTQQVQSLMGEGKTPDCGPILMTRKDWVKARRLGGWQPGKCVYVPVLSMDIDDPDLLFALVRGVF